MGLFPRHLKCHQLIRSLTSGPRKGFELVNDRISQIDPLEKHGFGAGAHLELHGCGQYDPAPMPAEEKCSGASKLAVKFNQQAGKLTSKLAMLTFVSVIDGCSKLAELQLNYQQAGCNQVTVTCHLTLLAGWHPSKRREKHVLVPQG